MLAATMAKRPDKGNDATQEVSSSQLVPTERPVLHRKGGNPQHDMSLWGGVVVGTSDFAPATPPKRSGRWKWLAAAGAIAAAATTFTVVKLLAEEPPPTPAVAPADAS